MFCRCLKCIFSVSSPKSPQVPLATIGNKDVQCKNAVSPPAERPYSAANTKVLPDNYRPENTKGWFAFLWPLTCIWPR